ncbi:MAG: SGNH/GDSL hydrolase family protein [Candidatus Omnitrophota bacterium]
MKREINNRKTIIFAKASLPIFVLSVALLLPLVFYRSSKPQVGPYSIGYLTFLFVSFVLVLAGSIAAGWASLKSNNLFPAFRILGFIILLVFFCITAEFLLRLKFNDAFSTYREWGHKKSIIFGFEAKPKNQWEAFGAKYTTDSFGFRACPGGDLWRDSNGRKIFVLGGSSAFGYGLNDNETWPYLLENILRKALNDQLIFVINAANNGHNSLQILLRFYLRVLPLHPTHIIFYENINDVNLGQPDPDGVLISEDILFSDSVAAYWAKKNQDKPFYFRTLLSYFVENFMLPRPQASSENNQGINAEYYIRNVKTLYEICDSNNIKLIIATFIHNSDKMGAKTRDAIKRYNQLLRELAQSKNIFLIDLERIFETIQNKEAYFFEDSYHPSKKGAEFIADKITEEVALCFQNG